MNVYCTIFFKVIVFCFVVNLLSACGGSGAASVTDNSNDNEEPISESNNSFTISGNVIVERDTDVDNDVEGRFDNLIEQNNSQPGAQLISNPVTLGGYISGKSIWRICY